MIAVTNFAIPKGDLTRENIKPEEACKMMEDLGADVVGLNCYRGPRMTMKLLEKIRSNVSCHVAGLPVPYRTTEEQPNFLNQTDKGCDCIPGGNAFPAALDNLYCNRYEMAEFAKECKNKKINFKYAVPINKSPITIKIFCNFSNNIKKDYKVFLTNNFNRYFKIIFFSDSYLRNP